MPPAAPVWLQVALPADYVPTPFVAAGVALLGCAAGIMVTASHNTKEYNGYKVRGPAHRDLSQLITNLPHVHCKV